MRWRRPGRSAAPASGGPARVAARPRSRATCSAAATLPAACSTTARSRARARAPLRRRCEPRAPDAALAAEGRARGRAPPAPQSRRSCTPRSRRRPRRPTVSCGSRRTCSSSRARTRVSCGCGRSRSQVRELLDAVARTLRGAPAGPASRSTRRPASSSRGDRLRLEQALGNLVDNALRYGCGTVRLDARQRRTARVEPQRGGRGSRLPRRPSSRTRSSASRAPTSREPAAPRASGSRSCRRSQARTAAARPRRTSPAAVRSCTLTALSSGRPTLDR